MRKRIIHLLVSLLLIAIGMASQFFHATLPAITRVPSAEPNFHFGRYQIDDRIVLLIDDESFYVYDNGAVRRLQRSENSVVLPLSMWAHIGTYRLEGRRHIHTQQLRWMNNADRLRDPTHELTFDFEAFSYTTTAIVDETWLERESATVMRHLWETDREVTQNMYAEGYPNAAMILQLLTEPDFTPEQVEWELYVPDWPAGLVLRFIFINIITPIFLLIGIVKLIFALIRITRERKAHHAPQSQNDIPM